MKDKEKQITEMPICVNCVHAYVCEEYNLNRDMLGKRCAYHNDHFLDIEQYKKHAIKETAEKYHKAMRKVIHERDYIRGYAEIGLQEENDKIAEQFEVEIKE